MVFVLLEIVGHNVAQTDERLWHSPFGRCAAEIQFGDFWAAMELLVQFSVCINASIWWNYAYHSYKVHHRHSDIDVQVTGCLNTSSMITMSIFATGRAFFD